MNQRKRKGYTTCFFLFLIIPLFFSVPSTLNGFINLRENAVQKLCEKVNVFNKGFKEEQIDPSYCIFYDSCDTTLGENLPEFECESRYDFANDSTCGCSAPKMSLRFPTIRFSPGVNQDNQKIKEFLCFSSDLRATFKDNQEDDEEIKWQYVASDYGAISLYPGTSWRYSINEQAKCKEEILNSDACPEFEARERNWYVSAASGPKNIVLLIDQSGSMSYSGNDYWQLAQEAAITVINGLTENDKAGVIFFHQETETCFEDLVSGTKNNKELLEQCIKEEIASGGTNFYEAFDAAFNMFEGEDNNCNNIILFLTDGENHGDDPISLIETKNKETNAKIFTFALGEDADKEKCIEIACAHEGLFTHIVDSSDLRTQMSSYYRYFAYVEDLAEAQIIWSAVFDDVAGLGKTTSVSMPCFSEDGELLAVAGIDVPLSQLEQYGNYSTELQLLQSRSKTCRKEIPQSYFNKIRAEDGNNYCVNPTDYSPVDSSTVLSISIATGIVIAVVIVIIIIIIAVTITIIFYKQNHDDNAIKNSYVDQPKPKQNEEELKDFQITNHSSTPKEGAPTYVQTSNNNQSTTNPQYNGSNITAPDWVSNTAQIMY